jgi:hypothetical protein
LSSTQHTEAGRRLPDAPRGGASGAARAEGRAQEALFQYKRDILSARRLPAACTATGADHRRTLMTRLPLAAPAADALPAPAGRDSTGPARPTAGDAAGGRFQDVRRIVRT